MEDLIVTCSMMEAIEAGIVPVPKMLVREASADSSACCAYVADAIADAMAAGVFATA